MAETESSTTSNKILWSVFYLYALTMGINYRRRLTKQIAFAEEWTWSRLKNFQKSKEMGLLVLEVYWCVAFCGERLTWNKMNKFQRRTHKTGDTSKTKFKIDNN
jgi:hypothetical protein